MPINGAADFAVTPIRPYSHTPIRSVLVTGGAGYVGAVLVPRLLEEGYEVRVIDLYIYGEDALQGCRGNPRLREINADIRDSSALSDALRGCDAVIHLACISNDPSVELDPELSKSINYDAFVSLINLSRDKGIQRFVFASSGSVYGVSDDPNVTEEHALVPVSLYNKYKAMCEPVLLEKQSPDFTTVIVRPATICGYSPRQRLDLTVNILTNHAVNADHIKVFGGEQMRPNLHMQDMVDLYTMLLELTSDRIAGQIYNAAYQNYSVMETAEIVKRVVTDLMPDKADLEIIRTPSDDIRSYHICSDKIRKRLGYVPKRTVEDAVRDLVEAFRAGKLPNPLADKRYFNIEMMKSIELK